MSGPRTKLGGKGERLYVGGRRPNMLGLFPLKRGERRRNASKGKKRVRNGHSGGWIHLFFTSNLNGLLGGPSAWAL